MLSLQFGKTHEQTAALRLRPKVVVRWMATIVFFLASASMITLWVTRATGHDSIHGLVRFFDLSQEMNLPTWYATTSLFICSLLLAAIATAETSLGTRARYWWGLSLVFLALSADEGGSFHEIFLIPVRTLLGVSGVFYYAWVIPAGILLLLGAAVYLRWFFGLPRRTQWLAALSASLFIGGAVILEMIEGRIVSRGGSRGILVAVLANVEETLEMCGVLVWTYTLLDYAESRGYVIRLGFGAGVQGEDARLQAQRYEDLAIQSAPKAGDRRPF